METILLVIAIGVMCLLCFIVGAKIGQKTVKGEDIELPTVNPVKVVRNYQEEAEARKEIEKLKIIEENIDNYNGTPYGQQELPK